MERLGCWSNRRRAAGAPTDALLTNGEFSLSCGGGGKVAVRSLILPILCLRSIIVGRAMLSAFQLFYIFPKICVNWCVHCPSSSAPPRRTHQSVPSGGSSFLYFFTLRAGTQSGA